MEKYCTSGQAIDDMNAHCRLDTKGINIQSEYAINIAFPQQQLLHERASCTLNVHCLSRSPCVLHSSLMITEKGHTNVC